MLFSAECTSATPFNNHFPAHVVAEGSRTFARNDCSQAVQALAGSTMKGTRPGLFASTSAFSCAAWTQIPGRQDEIAGTNDGPCGW